MTLVKQHAAFSIVQCCICTAGTPALLASFLMMGCKSLHRSRQYCGGWRIGKLSVPKSMLRPCSKEARRAAPPVRGMAGTIIYLLAKSFSANHGSDISPWTSAAGIQKITACAASFLTACCGQVANAIGQDFVAKPTTWKRQTASVG